MAYDEETHPLAGAKLDDPTPPSIMLHDTPDAAMQLAEFQPSGRVGIPKRSLVAQNVTHVDACYLVLKTINQ